MGASRRQLRLLLDECCGGSLGDALRAEGVDVAEVGRHPDLPRRTPDQEVMRWAGENWYAFLTRDRHLRTRPAELAAIKEAGIAVFFIPPSPRSRDEIRFAVLTALPRIERCLMRNAPPLVRRILPNGSIKDEKLG